MSHTHRPDDGNASGELDDQRLTEQVRNGDVIAFELLVRRFAQPLVRYAMVQTGNATIAEDIVQDVFASVWMRRDGLIVTQTLKSYLFRAVHHQAANYHRSVARRARYIDDVDADDESGSLDEVFRGGADDAVNEEDLRQAYVRGLARMPRRPREVFVLVREEGLSYADVAQILGISVRTVEEHMGRALVALRRVLRDWTR